MPPAGVRGEPGGGGGARAVRRGTAATWRRLGAEAEAAGCSTLDARRILERVSGYDLATLLTHLDDEAPGRPAAHARAMAARRGAGEPLQYVLGRWGFRRLELLVDHRVLVPRPETEVVAGVAIERLRAHPPTPAPRLVDLGTGSGAIALAVADEVPWAEVWATDESAGALAVARANLAGMGRRAGARVRLVRGSWYGALPVELRGHIDVVVANPPYVGAGEALPEEVAAWEPPGALVAGPDGLEAVRAVVAGAPAWLAPGGSLVVEIAAHQAAAAVALARSAGLGRPAVLSDLAGRPRVLVAQRGRDPGGGVALRTRP